MPTFQHTDLIDSNHIGVDEVGRGALVGDVVASAVILNHPNIQGLKDSKQLSPRQRMTLLEELKKHATYAVGRASATEIDQLNIHHASLLAMKRAILALIEQPEVDASTVLVDGKYTPTIAHLTLRAIVQGDRHCPSISAASIIAKVTRDQEMITLDQQYPAYGFAQHKGYPTVQHFNAIKKHGIIDSHRRSYRLLKPPMHQS